MAPDPENTRNAMSSERSTATLSTADRAAVEPLAALVAVTVVGLALGLYAGAFADATPDDEGATATATLDRVEGTVAVGGVVDPSRMRRIESLGTATAIELEAGDERWLAASGPDAPGPPGVRSPDAVAVAEQRVTVRVAPGRNVRGTLRAVVWR